ncbi:protein lin-37 homolog, partial [Phaenicophaeus curvirostris]|uniref:protein lin-37 homolog n=1 Tax=Phaenicophaeus curvirostris TaxID=33595 RepID=UPI0037F0A244
LEAASARSRLDAVLQGLVERGGREAAAEEEAAKAPGEAVNKEALPSAPGKRPPPRLPQQRRKKRREAEEGPEPHRGNTYVIKLFDRSVELGQFAEGTPLYPVCRAWMRNCPTVRGGAPQPPPAAPPEVSGKGEDVFVLPPPAPQVPPRVPSPLGPEEGQPPPDQPPDPPPSPRSLLGRNMERWRRVRQRWREAGQRQQQRYRPSLGLLRSIYERQ